jgi:quaternary ammonium compound-resistance protein SugE
MASSIARWQLTGAGIAASMLLLSQAAKSLPIGTAYGV